MCCHMEWRQVFRRNACQIKRVSTMYVENLYYSRVSLIRKEPVLTEHVWQRKSILKLCWSLLSLEIASLTVYIERLRFGGTKGKKLYFWNCLG